jgi:hypothetical protein
MRRLPRPVAWLVLVIRLSVDFYLPYMGKDRGRTKTAKRSPLYGLPFSLIVMPGLDPGIHAAAPT